MNRVDEDDEDDGFGVARRQASGRGDILKLHARCTVSE